MLCCTSRACFYFCKLRCDAIDENFVSFLAGTDLISLNAVWRMYQFSFHTHAKVPEDSRSRCTFISRSRFNGALLWRLQVTAAWPLFSFQRTSTGSRPSRSTTPRTFYVPVLLHLMDSFSEAFVNVTCMHMYTVGIGISIRLRPCKGRCGVYL